MRRVYLVDDCKRVANLVSADGFILSHSRVELSSTSIDPCLQTPLRASFQRGTLRHQGISPIVHGRRRDGYDNMARTFPPFQRREEA